MHTLQITLRSVFLLLGIVLSSAAQAQKATDFNKDGDGLFVDGYDLVSYLNQKEAVEGKKENTVTYQGASFRFSTAANKKLFAADPEKYLPAYGGWCAFAMGENGEKVEVNPKTFKIIDGKTYLFYNKFFTNTLTSWNKNEAILKAKADANWKNKFHSGIVANK